MSVDGSETPLRIVHVIGGLGIGGAEQVVTDLANAQSFLGHSVVVLTGEPLPKWRAEQFEPAVKVFAGRQFGRWRKYRSMARLIASARPVWVDADVVHVHLTMASAVGSILEGWKLLRGRAKRPVVIETDHATGASLSPALRHLRRLLRWNRAAVVSVMRGSQPVDVIPQRTSRVTITNGIKPLRRRHDWNPREPLRVGTLGVLRTDRQPEMYLQLLKCLLQERPTVLVYGGTGPLRAQIEKQAALMGFADQVQFEGEVWDKESFFSSVDVHVSLAVGPDYGLASLEAASTATPAFGVQLSERMDGSDCAIPSHFEVAQLALIILRHASNRQSLLALGSSQCDWVHAEHSVTKMSDSYLKLYVETLRRAG